MVCQQRSQILLTFCSSQSRIIEKSCMGKLFVDAQQPDAKAGRQQANSRKGKGLCSKQHHIFVLLFSYSSQGGSNRVLRMSEKRKNTFIHCKMVTLISGDPDTFFSGSPLKSIGKFVLRRNFHRTIPVPPYKRFVDSAFCSNTNHETFAPSFLEPGEL